MLALPISIAFRLCCELVLDLQEGNDQFPACLNCLSALRSIGTRIAAINESLTKGESQLPFGLDAN